MADDPTPPTPPAPPPPPFTPPPPSPQPIPTAQSAPSAVWSLILGIMSFVCGGFITAIPAIICGHIGRSTIKKSGGTLGGMGMATAGLVLGYIALVINLILIPAIAIPIFLKARDDARGRFEHVATNGKEIVSADGNTRLKVPEDWNEMKELNATAKLQAGNRSKEQFVIILSESKSDFDNLTLQKHHQITRDGMIQKMKNASAGDVTEITVDGQPALQDEISGTQDGMNIVFLHTTVEGEEAFHQILAWTSKSRWDQQKAELREITESFRSER
jgi:hypothetical protein